MKKRLTADERWVKNEYRATKDLAMDYSLKIALWRLERRIRRDAKLVPVDVLCKAGYSWGISSRYSKNTECAHMSYPNGLGYWFKTFAKSHAAASKHYLQQQKKARTK